MRDSFSVGDVLNNSFQITFANFLPFMLLVILVSSPMLVVSFQMLSLAEEFPTASMERQLEIQKQFGNLAIVQILGVYFLLPIATGAVTYGVFEQMSGRHASFGHCLSVGLSRMLPVIGISIVAGLIIVLMVALAIVLSVLISPVLLLLIIPGMILVTMVYVAVPCAVVERAGVFASLQRSLLLTKGARLSIFWVILVLGILGWGYNYLGEKVGEGLQGALIVFVLGAFANLLQATAAAYSYFQLRTVKEGLDLEELEAVFD